MAAAPTFSLDDLLQLTATKDPKEAERLVENKKRKARLEEERKRTEEERKRAEQRDARAVATVKMNNSDDKRRALESGRHKEEGERRRNRRVRDDDRLHHTGPFNGSSRRDEVPRKKNVATDDLLTLLKIAKNVDPNEFRLAPIVKISKENPFVKESDTAKRKRKPEQDFRRTINVGSKLDSPARNASPSSSNGGIFMNKKTTSSRDLLSSPAARSSPSSARERIAASAKATPLQRAQTQKRDQRTIDEIQADIRRRKEREKGIPSYMKRQKEEEQEREEAVRRRREELARRRDKERDTALRKGFSNGTPRSREDRLDRDDDRRRPLGAPTLSASRRFDGSPPRKLQRSVSPLPRKYERSTSLPQKGGRRSVASEPYRPVTTKPTKRAPSPPYRPNGTKSRNANGGIRSTDPYRPSGVVSRQRYDDEDSDMSSFIDDDEEEEEEYPERESVQGVLKDIFGYDRRKFRDELSDDGDMEAGASEVLREEARSTRIGKKEDAEEERREREVEERMRKRKLEKQKKEKD